LHRSIAKTEEELAEQALLEETITVRSIKERFESGGGIKSEKKVTVYQNIASTRREQKETTIGNLPSLALSIENSGLNEDYAAKFQIFEGIPRPPPTPFPHSSDVMDFESSMHPPQASAESESTTTTISSGSFDFDVTIRPPPVPETPIRPPDYWVKKPRRIPSPVRRPGPDEDADYSALVEMKSILSKFHQKRSRSPEANQRLQQVDSSVEVLPNDPSPSVAPKDIYDDQFQSDDSLDFLSTDDEEGEAETLDKILDRGDRLRPVKKRKVKFEVIGGGLVPRKTSLAQGPKFTSRELVFSQQPPRAYAYLEESFANDTGDWVPGQELSLDQYQEIRDENKRERYRKFLTSTPYYAFYDEAALLAAEGMAAPMTYGAYYPPVTVDDVYVIKLRSPIAPPPPPPPPLTNPDWYDIKPPPAYPFPPPQQDTLST